MTPLPVVTELTGLPNLSTLSVTRRRSRKRLVYGVIGWSSALSLVVVSWTLLSWHDDRNHYEGLSVPGVCPFGHHSLVRSTDRSDVSSPGRSSLGIQCRQCNYFHRESSHVWELVANGFDDLHADVPPLMHDFEDAFRSWRGRSVAMQTVSATGDMLTSGLSVWTPKDPAWCRERIEELLQAAGANEFQTHVFPAEVECLVGGDATTIATSSRSVDGMTWVRIEMRNGRGDPEPWPLMTIPSSKTAFDVNLGLQRTVANSQLE